MSTLSLLLDQNKEVSALAASVAHIVATCSNAI